MSDVAVKSERRHASVFSDPPMVFILVMSLFTVVMLTRVAIKMHFGWINPYALAETSAYGDVNYAHRYCPAVKGLITNAVADGSLTNIEVRRIGFAYYRVRSEEARRAARSGSIDPWSDVKCGKSNALDGTTDDKIVFWPEYKAAGREPI